MIGKLALKLKTEKINNCFIVSLNFNNFRGLPIKIVFFHFLSFSHSFIHSLCSVVFVNQIFILLAVYFYSLPLSTIEYFHFINIYQCQIFFVLAPLVALCPKLLSVLIKVDQSPMRLGHGQVSEK